MIVHRVGLLVRPPPGTNKFQQETRAWNMGASQALNLPLAAQYSQHQARDRTVEILWSQATVGVALSKSVQQLQSSITAESAIFLSNSHQTGLKVSDSLSWCLRRCRCVSQALKRVCRRVWRHSQYTHMHKHTHWTLKIKISWMSRGHNCC